MYSSFNSWAQYSGNMLIANNSIGISLKDSFADKDKSSHLEVFYKISILKIFTKTHRKIQVMLLSLKGRNRCFLINFGKKISEHLFCRTTMNECFCKGLGVPSRKMNFLGKNGSF